MGDKVIVFNITSEVPNDVIAASSLLPDSLQTAIYNSIAAFLDTEEGEAAWDGPTACTHASGHGSHQAQSEGS